MISEFKILRDDYIYSKIFFRMTQLLSQISDQVKVKKLIGAVCQQQ